MSGPVTPFEPGASLARIVVNDHGFAIDCGGPQASQRCEFATAGDAAEVARFYRDEGGWRLRFGAGTDEVRALVAELDELESDGGAT